MKTVLVAGSDTGVGKTWVVASIARILSRAGNALQIVKPVETGAANGHAGDARKATELSGGSSISFYTLQSFGEPLAPVAAAELEGRELSLGHIVAAIQDLPEADWRIVEGAGSVATPLEKSGADWTDLALAIEADWTVLVVEDKLGAIGQSRLACAYAAGKSLRHGLWLNEIEEQDTQTRESTLEGVRSCGLPLWGKSASGRLEPVYIDCPWLEQSNA